MVWFRTHPERKDLVLYCDNPQCGLPINEEEVAYNKEHRKIYHVGECVIEATAHMIFKSGEAEIQNLDYISSKKTLRLLRRGRLKQSQELEEKTQTLI